MRENIAVCVSAPLVALTVTVKVPVDVPVVTTKLTGAEAPPPGVGLVTTTGSWPVEAN